MLTGGLSDPLDSARRHPDIRARLAVAALAGIIAGSLAAYTQIVTGPPGADYRLVWEGAVNVLHGIDPYGIQNGAIAPLVHRFFYPLPGALLGMTFSWLGLSLGAVCFSVASAAFLMFAMTEDGFERVPVILSVPFLVAGKISQTTPLVTALALTPPLAALSFLKPNIGLAMFARSPKLAPVVLCAILFALAWVAFPSWPQHWLMTMRNSPAHASPMRTSLGAAGLLGLLRWRRPEARLLVAMTVIPHGLEFYDELPLWLVAVTRREAMLLTLASWVGCLGWLAFGDGGFMHSPPWSTAFLYVPAAALVLRRKNEGEIPAWLESGVHALPSFLRGSAVAGPTMGPRGLDTR
jgi:hypothetical protein